MPNRRRLAAVATFAALAAVVAVSLGVGTAMVRSIGVEIGPYFADPPGHAFFFTQDSYYFYRQAAEVLDHGYPGTRRQDGEAWDDLSFAPGGRPARGGLLAVLLAAVARPFGGEAALVPVSAYLPAAIDALTALLMVPLGRRLGGLACGLLAALFVAVHPQIAESCPAGVVDTTCLNLFFLTATAWLCLELAEGVAVRSHRRTATAAMALAAVLALFRWTWVGWLGGAALAAAYLGGRALTALLGGGAARRGWGRRARWAAAGAIALLLAAGAALLVASPLRERALAYVGEAPAPLFPLGTAQVRELQPLGAGALLAGLGGPLFVVLAALGAGWALRWRPWTAALPVAWLVAAVAAGAAAQRFLVFAVPPAALLAAFALRRLAAAPIRTAAASGGTSRRRRASVALAAAATLLVLASFAPPLAASFLRRPALDRSVYLAARAIANRAAPDALVDSWWDRGYAYAALSGRGVVLDGGSFQSSRLYWFSRALASDDEILALNLLRMISCGVDHRIFELVGDSLPPARAVAALDGALRTNDRAAARESLTASGVEPEAARAAAMIADRSPPETWLVVSSDLAEKTTSWLHYARWNFGGANPEPPPAITAEVGCRLAKGELACDNGLAISLVAGGFAVEEVDGRFAARGRPRADGLVPIVYDRGDGLRLVHVDASIVDSLFVRLYYFRGVGLPHFRLAYEAYQPPLTDRVLVYRIGWRRHLEGEPGAD
jgi:asparagine N-glycosylation enzyme membrane subunit Stt3